MKEIKILYVFNVNKFHKLINMFNIMNKSNLMTELIQCVFLMILKMKNLNFH